MSTLLSAVLPNLTSSASSGKYVTNAPDTPRVEVGLAVVYLQREMMAMYWAGVKRELPHILLTLRKWQTRPEYRDAVLADEQDTLIHGFDTFLDQVSHSSRTHAQKYGPYTTSDGALPSYTEALEDRGWDIFAERQSTRVRQAIRNALDVPPPAEVLQRRARMLLQSAQFLDIDKMIEYRQPEKHLAFWKRPGPPQLTVSSYDDVGIPILAPQACSICYKTIRSALFKKVSDESFIICEGCYREKHYRESSFTKEYKTCCLPKAMTPEAGRRLCNCNDVRRRDSNGRLRALWPIDPAADEGAHIKGGAGRITCGVEQLTDMVADAKYAATRMKADDGDSLGDQQRRAAAEMQRLMGQDERQRRAHSKKDKKDEKLDRLTHPARTVSEFGTSQGMTTSVPEQIPSYLQGVTDNYPYGNVHMALRIGPLIIENGVAK
jgi:hypothetical protein